MAQEFKLPELGEDIDKATVTSVLVKSGDTIEKDQGVVEVETDKATAEVPSSVEGKVKEVHVQEGDEVEVGQLVLTVESDGKPEKDGKRDGGGKREAGDGKDEEKKVSGEQKRKAGEEDDGAGARQDREEKQAKAAAGDDGEDRDAGGEPRGRKKEEEEKREAEPDREREDGRKGGEEAGDREAARKADQAAGRGDEPVAAAPSVRRLARELGVSLDRVAGSGPGGRISEDDVKKEARRIIASRRGSGAAAPGAPGLPDFSRWGEVRREAMSGIRKATAEHMAAAWSQVPQVTQHDQADVREVESFRSDWNAGPRGREQKLSMTAILVKVSAAALRAFPAFNASVDPEAGEIVYKDYVHVGVAVDTERGLLVPVIRDADRKGLLAIAGELEELASRARGRKLQSDEMRGGSFTVTNLGGLGTTYFSPIVNWPEVAILGAGRAAARPLPEGPAGSERLVLPLSISYDHRAVDGADAARFLRWIAEALENPLKLVLEG